MTIRTAIAACAMLSIGFGIAAAPAAAEDGEEKLGLAAGLGLTAATGKTTIAEGGGAIEAALLTSDAVREAGRVIAALTTAEAGGRNVLVLSKSEQVNLMAAATVLARLETIKRALTAAGSSKTCEISKQGIQKMLEEQQLSSMGLAPTDTVAALATDTTYAPIPLTLDDRMLIGAIGMSGTTYKLAGSTDWRRAELKEAGGGSTRFMIPSEIVYVGSNDGIIGGYQKMLERANALRVCATDEAKAAVAAADAYAKELTTPGEKTGISPLGAAIQARTMIKTASGGEAKPYLLRVAVEQTGGTAITRGNIWYTLGFPGAATITAGLLTSYRLVDPEDGTTVSAGFVRCVVAPVSMSNVHLVVNKEAQNYFNRDSRRGSTYCSYVATVSPARG